MRYKNERFKSGHMVDIYFNPFLTVAGTFNPVLDNTPSNTSNISITHDAGGLTLVEDGVIASSQIGGFLGSVVSSEFDMVVPKDAFLNIYNKYMVKLEDDVYFFKDDWNKISDCYISNYDKSTDYGTYDQSGIVYSVNSEYFIDVIIKQFDWDKMQQLMMSVAVAVKSCDETVESSVDVPLGINYAIPLGGGSFNPIIRMGSIQTESLRYEVRTRTATIRIKLLG